MKALRTLWSRVAGRGRRDTSAAPMPPERHKIRQGTQTRFRDCHLSYMFRDGDSAVLGLAGETLEYRSVQAQAGQTVQSGPYEITFVALEEREGHDYVHVIISTPGVPADEIPESNQVQIDTSKWKGRKLRWGRDEY